ncbi:small lysine-rich protein 1 [Pseudophryne corroboree]|uniref:small lysine-rich protein 1 n=1 Tax=Pseudophryne corroboree TaxID=495146 RepID=UPI0030818270
MPTKSAKSKGSAKPKSKGKKSKKSKKSKEPKAVVDILSPEAMLNAYYISHNVVDCLGFRGFSWPGAPKKKGKKGKKKGKKK